MKGKILVAPLGQDVHVAGINKFSKIAEKLDYEVIFLGPGIGTDGIVNAIINYNPDIVGVSYRLTPETAISEVRDFIEAVKIKGLYNKQYVLAGTEPVLDAVREFGFFDEYFASGDSGKVLRYLKGDLGEPEEVVFGNTLRERIEANYPFPIIRHHLGLPTMEQTLDAVREIAESETVDVVSIAPDQTAQESFFHPERHDPKTAGAGGVPIRSENDLMAIYEASRTGNYPLLRIYAGTNDFIKLAELYDRTINNAWAAIPLFWFNHMDGRGPLSVEDSIKEHQELMKWYGDRDLFVEPLEAHHWSLRDAHDTISVLGAYLGALNAAKQGVDDIILQCMMHTPVGTSTKMDLAKMLAKKELIEEIPDISLLVQTRTGLLSYPADMSEAKAHLAHSVGLQMYLNPDIVHVVSYSEAHHASTSKDIVDSCKMARFVISQSLDSLPDISSDPEILQRKDSLKNDVRYIIDHSIETFGSSYDDLSNPEFLSKMIESGIMDTPQLLKNYYAMGTVRTRMVNGACVPVDDNDEMITEKERLNGLVIK
ncbi:MAG: cobalamin-dependent protein [Nanoarchaeota archaeon]